MYVNGCLSLFITAYGLRIVRKTYSMNFDLFAKQTGNNGRMHFFHNNKVLCVNALIISNAFSG